ncbi:MAG: tRNA (adenosine(37)-N6)-threonylcarbamoyltransferase complex transferase subunit TsaD [Patescibacteria group bacterium]
MKSFTILAIETSCDETAVAIIEASENNDIRILSNVISSQIALHAQYGGVVPSLASREHVKNIRHVFESALKEAGITDFQKEINLIVVTHGPGLGPTLLVGITFAKTLAWHYTKPIIGVNHMDGHIHSNWLPGRSGEPAAPLPDFPLLNLVVSGGHTELVLMKNHGEYEIIGETMDDAVGEAFDKVARLLGLGYPGGPAISKLAEQGNAETYPLPSPMAKSKNYNFSYSGLKTAVLYLLRDLKEKAQNEQTKADIAASFQKAAVDVLVSKTMRAAQEYQVNGILLSGGVSANKLLREQLLDSSSAIGMPFFCPSMKYTTDNAAMIAVAGYFASLSKDKAGLGWQSIRMDANLRLS